MSQPDSRTADAAQSLLAQYLSLAVLLVQGVFLVPLYFLHIGTSLYGAWLATGQILTWLSLVDPGSNDVMKQRLALSMGRCEGTNVGRIAGSGLAIGIAFVLVQLAVGLIAAKPLTQLPSLSAREQDQLTIAFTIGVYAHAVNLLAFIPGTIVQGLQRQAIQARIYTAGSVVYLVSLYLLVTNDVGVQAFPLSLLIRGVFYLAGSGGACLWIWKKSNLGKCEFDRHEAFSTIQLSLLNAISRTASVLQQNTDLFLVAKYLGAEPVVILSLSSRIFDFLRGVFDRLGHTIVSPLANFAASEKDVHVNAVIWRVINGASCWIWFAMGLGIAVNESLVTIWTSHSKYGGLLLSTLIAFLAGTTVISGLLMFCLFALGHISQTSKYAIMQASSKIILTVVLLKIWGLTGVVVGGILSSLPYMFVLAGRGLTTTLGKESGRIKESVRQNVYCLVPSFLLGSTLATLSFGMGWKEVGWKTALYCIVAIPVIMNVNAEPVHVARKALRIRW